MRLLDGRFAASAPPVTLTLDGRPLEALPGETIAAALAAAGEVATRQTVGGAPRGLFCGMGTCFDCRVTVDGWPNQRACMTEVRAGMVVQTQDRTRPADPALLAEAPPPQPTEERACAVLVVGAGPAGLAAALAARQAGAEVVLLDERAYPGGQYFKQPAASLRPSPDGPDAQHRGGRRLIEAARAAGVELVGGATVWGAFARDEIAAVIGGRYVLFRPRQVILAAGAYERPVPFPGWTLPGVMTTGAAQTLLRAYRVFPGRRMVIAGNGPLNVQVAAELVAAGVEVAAVAEAAPHPAPGRLGALARAALRSPDLMRDGMRYLRRLRRGGVRLLWGHVATAVEGARHAERVTLAPIDAAGRIDRAAATAVDADAVCLGYGFVPSTELARQLGCRLVVDPRTGEPAPMRNADGLTSMPGVFVVGDGGGLGGARVAQEQGALAGIAAAAALGFAPADGAGHRTRLARHRAFQDALWEVFAAPRIAEQLADDGTVVCRCEEVTLGTLRQAFAEGLASPRAVKEATRVAMGRCQGRYCGPSLRRLLAGLGSDVDGAAWFGARPPAKPLPIAPVVFEKPDWGRHKRLTPPPIPVGPVAQATLPATDVLIIGGGIVGCSLARFLARDGVETCLLDGGALNGQGSGTNAGNLHVQLQSYFAKGPDEKLAAAAPALRLFRMAVALWRELAPQLGTDIGLSIHGGIILAETEEELALIRRKAAFERSCGLDVEILSAQEVRGRYPEFSERVVGAELCPDEGSANPLLAGPALARAAAGSGARILTQAPVLAIERRGRGFAVTTVRGTIECARLINAAGPWGAGIGAMLGVDLPISGVPLHMNVTEAAPRMLSMLVEHASRHLTMKQVPAGNLIIGGGWPSRVDPATGTLAVLRSSIEGNLWVAQRVVPGIGGLHLLRAWTGFAPVVEDNTPILGAIPGVPGFYACLCEYGFTLGPLCARLVADIVTGRNSSIDLTPYSVARFARGA